jgi:ABC-2 type transport system ATP-binding protein
MAPTVPSLLLPSHSHFHFPSYSHSPFLRTHGGRRVIEVQHLTKRFGQLVAVDDVSFRVEQGEVVGFLGPNGAGKTTVMRILTAFLPATSGTVRVAGADPFWQSLAVRRQVGYLPESVPLYAEMRVAEYLFHRARLKGVAACERKRRVAEVMERCGIPEVAHRLIGQLSRGYRQRVGLADALVNDPPILILDEPTVGLDPNQVRLVREMIRELGRDRTVLLSTHILSEVELICPRVIVLSAGRLVADGRTADILAREQASLEEVFTRLTRTEDVVGHEPLPAGREPAGGSEQEGRA